MKQESSENGHDAIVTLLWAFADDPEWARELYQADDRSKALVVRGFGGNETVIRQFQSEEVWNGLYQLAVEFGILEGRDPDDVAIN